jgi:hypothetical protein
MFNTTYLSSKTLKLFRKLAVISLILSIVGYMGNISVIRTNEDRVNNNLSPVETVEIRKTITNQSNLLYINYFCFLMNPITIIGTTTLLKK